MTNFLSFAGKAVSLTPWTEDINAAAFDLFDVSIISFADLLTNIQKDGDNLEIRIKSGGTLTYKDGTTSKVSFSSSKLKLFDGENMNFGTTNGTKIGDGTTNKIGFWNVTPIVQPSHIADPTGGSVIDIEARAVIDLILADLATTGLQAAS